MMHAPERYRVTRGSLSSSAKDGNNGCFMLPTRRDKVDAKLRVICSDDMMWEHVSVSLPHRCPTWTEMCFVKELFWDEEDVVMQLHPPKSTWISNHPYCLHLWRPVNGTIPLPPSVMVGYQDLGTLV